MADQERYSSTMRIDLIPDVKVPSGEGTKKRVVIGAKETERPSLTKPRIIRTEQPEERYYQALLQSMYDAAIISDLEGSIVDVNARAVGFLGYTDQEIQGKAVFDVISGADEQLIGALWENLQNERHTLIQAYCERKDGSFFPSEIAVSRLDLDSPHLCFFVRDITIRKQAEEMLLTEHCAIQNSAGGIAITDLEGIVEFVNPMAAKLFGGTEEDLPGVPLADLVVEPVPVNEIVNDANEPDEAVWESDVTIKRSDGSTLYASLSCTQNRNSEGDPVGLVISLVDLSDRVRAENAERISERHRVMLESLGAACHHVGQPATILMGNLQFLSERLNDADEDVKKLAERCLSAMSEISETLKRLNSVNEYKTRQYLAGAGDDDAASRILEI